MKRSACTTCIQNVDVGTENIVKTGARIVGTMSIVASKRLRARAVGAVQVGGIGNCDICS